MKSDQHGETNTLWPGIAENRGRAQQLNKQELRIDKKKVAEFLPDPKPIALKEWLSIMYVEYGNGYIAFSGF